MLHVLALVRHFPAQLGRSDNREAVTMQFEKLMSESAWPVTRPRHI